MTDTTEHHTHVAIRGPEDLLALIEHQLGYRPVQGVVLFLPLVTGGGLCLSMGLPPEDSDPQTMGKQLKQTLADVSHLGTAAVVVYGALSHAELVAMTIQSAKVVINAQLETLTLLCVNQARAVWWDLSDPGQERSLMDVRDSVLNAQLVAMGSSVDAHIPGKAPEVPDVFFRRAHTLALALEQETAAKFSQLTNDSGPAMMAEQCTRTLLDTSETSRRVDQTRVINVPTSDSAAAQILAWEHAIAAVAENPDTWWDALLALEDQHLLELGFSLAHTPLWDALFYGWITGEPHGALAAHAGMMSALNSLDYSGVPSHDRELSEQPGLAEDSEEIHQAIRCSRVVSGEWEGRPQWHVLEQVYRILTGLDFLLTALSSGSTLTRADPETTPSNQRWCEDAWVEDVWGGGEHPEKHSKMEDWNGHSFEEARWDERHWDSVWWRSGIHADVISAMAQLEIYRGRANTAARLLERCQSITPLRDSAAVVAHRLASFSVPWWVTDALTAWPGARPSPQRSDTQL